MRGTGTAMGAGVVMLLGAVYLTSVYGWRQAALLIVGVAAGVVLYHAAFGFTSAWRALIADRNGKGLRAQMLMLALTCVVFVPLLARGQIFDTAVRGSVAPVGVPVIVGALMFGVGMQLGGGCASGTLFTAGGGNLRMVVTLLAFIAGSVLGAWHFPIWEAMPASVPVSFVARYGAAAALAISFGLLLLVTFASFAIERTGATARESTEPARGSSRWLRGPWPLVAGAFGLAAVNIATLVLAGRPWGVTSAFALWGSKTLAAAQVDVASWAYWQPPARAAELRASVFNDITSVMDFGIIMGALVAANLAGRFAPSWRIPVRSLAAALLGGLLLGYGARIAYGCNIGAFFSGVASASLHGWVWFAAAFIGNIVGTRLRPFFGLRV
jgi:uncharacterized membrane protein YedE/YeeE